MLFLLLNRPLLGLTLELGNSLNLFLSSLNCVFITVVGVGTLDLVVDILPFRCARVPQVVEQSVSLNISCKFVLVQDLPYVLGDFLPALSFLL